MHCMITLITVLHKSENPSTLCMDLILYLVYISVLQSHLWNSIYHWTHLYLVLNAMVGLEYYIAFLYTR